MRSGEWKGFSGKSIRDVVNIGIGGSDLVSDLPEDCQHRCAHGGAVCVFSVEFLFDAFRVL